MAGCELNIAHAFVAPPPAHRMRHDVIVTPSDEYDASRRSRCVQDDDAETDRGGMIPRYRLVPSTYGPGVSGEWVTLSKSVLLQLVERICQLSFQTDSLAAAAATAGCPSVSPPSDRNDASAESSMYPVKSSVVEAERSGCLSPLITADVDASASCSRNVIVSNADRSDELTAAGQGAVDDVPTLDGAALMAGDTGAVPVHEDGTTQDSHCDDNCVNDSDVFIDPLQEGSKTENSSSLSETPPSTAVSSDMALSDDPIVSVAQLNVTRKPPSPKTSVRSTQSSPADRRRRLRQLRRLRRHHQVAVTADNPGRDRQTDVIVRRPFAVPRQLPPFFQDRLTADMEYIPDRTLAEAPSPMRLPVGCCYRRMFQPWSALNKVVICQLIDVLLNQEMSPTTTIWRSAPASNEKKRSSGTIWNPAITPETRECRTSTPPHLTTTVNDLSSFVSPSSVERGSSTLLHSLLSPMAAAAPTTYLDRRRSEMSSVDTEVDSSSLAWTMSQSSSSSGRRRHHSAAASDTFRVPWTSPSFFWYSVPPSQGNFLLLPDAASRPPCYRWISATQPITAVADGCALDYRAKTLDAGDNHAHEATEAVSTHPGLSKSRDTRPSTPPASVASRRRSSARLKWVVVNKTDVCSLFESLASSMVPDSDDKRTSEKPSHLPAGDNEMPGPTDQGSCAVSCVSGEPIKWKSTLLRRARAEAQTRKRSGSDGDVADDTHVLFHADC